jgi:hypothetical protein
MQVAFLQIFNTNTTSGNWDTATVTTWKLVPILVIITFIIIIVYMAVKEA